MDRPTTRSKKCNSSISLWTCQNIKTRSRTHSSRPGLVTTAKGLSKMKLGRNGLLFMRMKMLRKWTQLLEKFTPTSRSLSTLRRISSKSLRNWQTLSYRSMVTLRCLILRTISRLMTSLWSSLANKNSMITLKSQITRHGRTKRTTYQASVLPYMYRTTCGRMSIPDMERSQLSITDFTEKWKMVTQYQKMNTK